jgi:hypothetical protein
MFGCPARVISGVAALPLCFLLAGCTAENTASGLSGAAVAPPQPERMDRADVARVAMNSPPMRNMPPDHRFKTAMIGSEYAALFSGDPQRCVVVHLETPRGGRATTILVTKVGPTSHKVTYHASGYEADACNSRGSDLRPFPELQKRIDAVKVQPDAYCEELNGAAATPGGPWRCRFDGKKGFPNYRER